METFSFLETLKLLFFIFSLVLASSHFDNSEEHQSGYGYADQSANFENGNHWLDSNAKHEDNGGVFDSSQQRKETNKLADSGSTKHLDENTNRGKDLKSSKYGFFDYHYVEPQYHIEKFFTNEKRGREFDHGNHNNQNYRHQNRDSNADQTEQHQYHAKDANFNANNFDRSDKEIRGHKDSFDEHQNLLDKSSHIQDIKNSPFKDGHYVPLFSPY